MGVKNIRSIIFSLVVLGTFVFSATTQADMIVYKAYKQAFTDSHPKCSTCHVDAMPKKADGQHEWNAYGLAIKNAAKGTGIADVPTDDDINKFITILGKTGKAEDFKDSGK